MHEMEPKAASAEGPKGLGGWLILVGIGVVITPLRLGAVLFMTYPPMFESGLWDTLTTPGSQDYLPYFGAFLIFEIGVNLAFMLLGVYLALLYFTKSYRFPMTYIAFMGANLFFILADAWLGSLVIPELPMFDPDTTRELARTAIAAAIWIPYMRLSARVKATFVEGRPAPREPVRSVVERD